jgi:hypothetical protein
LPKNITAWKTKILVTSIFKSEEKIDQKASFEDILIKIIKKSEHKNF